MRPKWEVTTEHLKSLQPQALLVGDVIDAYCRQLERRSVRFSDRLPSTLCVDLCTLESWEKGRFPQVLRRFRTENPFNKDLVLFPIHTPGVVGHFSLIVVRPQLKRVECYDSLGMSHKQKLYGVYAVLKYYAGENKIAVDGSAWHLQDTVNTTPRQQNGVDCGVFVCWYADQITRGRSITTPGLTFDPEEYRSHIAYGLSVEVLSIRDFERVKTSPPPVSQQFSKLDDEPPALPISVEAESLEHGMGVLSLNMTDSIETLIESAMVDLEEPVPDCMGAMYDPRALMDELDNYLSPMPVDMSEENPQSISSLCLSLEPDEDLLSEWLEDAVVVEPPTVAGNTRRDGPLVVVDDTIRENTESEVAGNTPRDSPMTVASNAVREVAESESASPPLEAEEAPRIPKRKREKKYKVFFPGVGFKRVRNRFIRRDLQW